MRPDELLQERDPRVFLAIERTFLAWTRTALALMGFGFVVARIGLFLRELPGRDRGPDPLLSDSSASLWLGTALVVLGVLIEGLALLDHQRLVRRFRAGEAIVARGPSLSTAVGVALLAIGAAVVAYLVQLF